MLPRLVIAAVLVNVSFWICALAVDLSNIVGYSLKSLLDGIMKNNMTSLSWDSIWSLLITGAGLGGLTAGIGAGAAAATATMGIGLVWLVLPLLILAVISVLTALFVLIVRQALVIILIVLSPLAFVAFLLPNTEKWFTKWRELFMTMLLFFPLFSLLFGGATLAMNILISAAESIGSQAGNNDPWRAGILFISGITIQFLVMFSAPFAVKFSGSTVGGIAGKFQGGLTKMSAPLNKISKDKLELSQKSNLIKYNEAGSGGLFGRGVRGFQRFRRRDKALGAKYDAQINRANEEWTAREGVDDNNERIAAEHATATAKLKQNEEFLNSITTDIDLKLRAAGIGANTAKLDAMVIAQANKETREAIDNIKSTVSSYSIVKLGEELSKALVKGDHHTAIAIQESLSAKSSAGAAELGNAVSRAQAVDPGGVSSYMASHDGESFRNSLMSTPGLKGIDAATLEWAKNGGASSIDTVRADPATYDGLKIEDILSQSGGRSQYDSTGVRTATASNQESVFRARITTKKDARAILSDREAVRKLEPNTIAYLRSL